MEEIYVMQIIAALNNIKHTINPALNNKKYQEWVERNELDRDTKFRDWVIEDAKKEILKIIDTSK